MEPLVLLVFAFITGLIAHSRGRSAIGWAILGFLFQCFAIILLLVLPDLNLEEERREELKRENRRLSEQLKKERQVADARHAQTVSRLGAHDAVLGVDTSDEDPRAIAAEDGEAPPNLPATRAAAEELRGKRWHYALDEESGTEGPVPFEELRDMWVRGVLADDALVWTKGMGDWTTIADHGALRDELDRG